MEKLIEDLTSGLSIQDFGKNYNKIRRKELSEMETVIGLPRLVQRMKDLGIIGCIEKVSMKNVNGVGGMLVRYLWIKTRNMLGK